MEKLGRNIPAVYLETASTMIWVVIGRLVSVARPAIIGDLAGQTLCPVTAWKKRLAAVGLLMGSNGTGLERPREKTGHGDLLQRTHFYLCTRLMLPGEATRAIFLVSIFCNEHFPCFSHLSKFSKICLLIQSRPIQMRGTILCLANRWMDFKMLSTPNSF